MTVVSICRALFKPLVEQGFVSFVYGGAQQGSFLCNHPSIDMVHLTGSAQTYDAIVWGGKKKARALGIRLLITFSADSLHI